VRIRYTASPKENIVISMTISSGSTQDLFDRLIEKETELSRSNETMFRDSQAAHLSQRTWVNTINTGKVNLEKCQSGMVVAVIQSNDTSAEWILLSLFTRFLDRHFKNDISGYSIAF
jgi:hypothetical protein